MQYRYSINDDWTNLFNLAAAEEVTIFIAIGGVLGVDSVIKFAI